MIPGALIGSMKALARAARMSGGLLDEHAMLSTLLAATLVLCTPLAGAETVRVGGTGSALGSRQPSRPACALRSQRAQGARA